MTTTDTTTEVYAAVLARHPHLTGEALARKVARVTAILAHSRDGPTWTTR